MLNKVKTIFSKPHNVILLLLGIVLTFTTVAPIISIVQDTVTVHVGTMDSHLTGQTYGYTFYNWQDLFTGTLAKTNLWSPLLNTVLLSVHLRRRHSLRRAVRLPDYAHELALPQIPQLHLHLPLHHAPVDAGRGVAEPVQLQRRHRHVQRPAGRHAGRQMPLWWCKGLFPSLMVLGLHYAPFAYILIGGIFRNMDANLEEAATILDTPKWKTMFRSRCPWSSPPSCPPSCWCSAAPWALTPCPIIWA